MKGECTENRVDPLRGRELVERGDRVRAQVGAGAEQRRCERERARQTPGRKVILAPGLRPSPAKRQSEQTDAGVHPPVGPGDQGYRGDAAGQAGRGDAKLKDGSLDAFFFVGGAPAGAIAELASSG